MLAVEGCRVVSNISNMCGRDALLLPFLLQTSVRLNMIRDYEEYETTDFGVFTSFDSLDPSLKLIPDLDITWALFCGELSYV